MRITLAECVCVAAICVLAGSADARGNPYLGPSEYFEHADSPFYERVGFFEDFEDGVLDMLGVSFNTGHVIGPGFNVDSVDADDGIIDGNGNNGHSWFVVGSAGVLDVIFDAEALGGLPSWAGIVWTDGRDEVIFEAFDADGVSIA